MGQRSEKETAGEVVSRLVSKVKSPEMIGEFFKKLGSDISSLLDDFMAVPDTEPKSKRVNIPDTFENRAAVHESGHTVLAWACTAVTTVPKVTIEAKSGGLTHYSIHGSETPAGRWCHLAITLAGLAAEVDTFGKIHSAESKSDLLRALEIAEALAADRLLEPPWKTPKREKSLPWNRIYSKSDQVQNEILKRSYLMAHGVIRGHGERYYRLIALLLQKRTVEISDLEAILGSRAIKNALGVLKPVFITPA